MACSCCELQHQNLSSDHDPHFFKIVLEDTLSENKLKIPPMFVKKYGDTLTSCACLKLPNGLIRIVEVKKCKGEIWFEKGWPEIIKNYSINHGYFLVFRYEMNSHFQVIIFDKTCTNIEYPISVTLFDDPKTEGKSSTFPNSKKKSPILSCPLSEKRMRKSPEYIEIKSETSEQDSDCSESKITVKVPNDAKAGGDKSTSRRGKKAKLVNRASNFKSKNPYFEVVMSPTYTRASYYELPNNFVKTYLDQKQYSSTAILKLLDGRTWPVEFRYKSYQTRRRALLGQGWKKFASDNNLQVDDVCVFVLLMKGNEVVFKVEIFPSSSDHFHKLKCEENVDKEVTRSVPFSNSSNAAEAASKFDSNNPFFKVNITSFSVERRFLSIPIGFCRSYVRKKEQMVTLEVEKRTWEVKLIVYKTHGKLSTGLSDFVRDNSIKAKDVCIFELIKSGCIQLKVSIFRSIG